MDGVRVVNGAAVDASPSCTMGVSSMESKPAQTRLFPALCSPLSDHWLEIGGCPLICRNLQRDATAIRHLAQGFRIDLERTSFALVLRPLRKGWPTWENDQTAQTRWLVNHCKPLQGIARHLAFRPFGGAVCKAAAMLLLLHLLLLQPPCSQQVRPWPVIQPRTESSRKHIGH